VTQHPQIHHPIRNGYDPVGDESQFSYGGSTFVLYHLNPPTFILHYLCCWINGRIVTGTKLEGADEDQSPLGKSYLKYLNNKTPKKLVM
jgi:hypothetical protein